MNGRRERGMTLVVALIMLLLLTLMVSTSFTLSKGSLEGVANQQWRSEALAAADTALEEVISSDFSAVPSARSIDVDLTRDGAADYVVSVTQPVCISVRQASAAPPSSLPLQFSSLTWNTIWELVATVQDGASGASVRVRSAVRILLNDAQKNALCP